MDKVSEAALLLNQGQLVIFPTETVFGVGCLVTNKKAIERLYQIKGRTQNKPTLVLVDSLATARKWVNFNQPAERLAHHFWPGPLTICLPVRKEVPKQVLGPDNTLGVRVSSHWFLQQLLPKLRAPLLAPSANLQGEKPAKSLVEIDKRLVSLVDYVVDIEPEAKDPSTIVTFFESKCKIVRNGNISQASINKVLTSKE